MIPYRELEHTADIGLEIYGTSVNGLFINAVKGLFHFISPQLEELVTIRQRSFPDRKKILRIELSASTQEELLVHWLNEFIYNFFVKGLFPKTIRLILLTNKNLEAEIVFEKNITVPKINVEIKAATYHNVSVKRFNDRYQARVIFDV